MPWAFIGKEVFKRSLRLINCWLVWAFLGLTASHARQLPNPPAPITANSLSSDWLFTSPDGSLQPFNPSGNSQARALHQWLYLQPGRPFFISFKATAGLSVFLNNRLVWKAQKNGHHTVNLADTLFFGHDSLQRVLFTVWHPYQQPDYASFALLETDPADEPATETSPYPLLNKQKQTDDTYTIMLLAVGLLFGFLRIKHPADWNSIFRPALFSRQLTTDESFYKKPILSPASLLFLLVFSLSLSLVTVVIQRSLHETLVLHQTFDQSRTGIIASVLTGTVVVLIAMLGKYLFLSAMGSVFNLGQLVPVQYREFIRYSLLLGLFLPMILLVYLAIGNSGQNQVLLASNIVLMLLLIVPMVRVFYLIVSKYNLGSIQLICYLCATEVIPLAIILKIIFLSY